MSRCRIVPAARRDLKEIYQHIAADNPAASGRLREIFAAKFRRLARHPLIGQKRDDLALGVRVFPAGSYVILYRPIESGIEIIQVLHGARDIAEAFRHPPDRPEAGTPGTCVPRHGPPHSSGD